jgi:uncharacterized membrane protein SpoIIM required for sporulation
MVLESLINPLGAELNPKKMFLYGMLYSSVAVFLSLWIFEGQSSLVMVFLTTMACIPLIYNTMKVEEQKDENIREERTLMKEHAKALEYFVFLFMGMVVAMTFWYVVLPAGLTDNLFSVQLETMAKINPTTGMTIEYNALSQIFLNNVQVLVFSLLFSFLYGVGAIFILAWNASVIAVAIGIYIRREIAYYATAIGLSKIGVYFKASSLGLLRYAIHGIPEIFAYFTAGLAGGIISVAIMRHGLDFDKFKRIIMDTTDLILLSVAVLFVAAVLEVYVTHAIFGT